MELLRYLSWGRLPASVVALCVALSGCGLLLDDGFDPQPGPPPDAGTGRGDVGAPECTIDISCDDGNVCNGEEECIGDACVSGQALDCDDDVACTVDSCDAMEGCFHIPDDGLCDSTHACDPFEGCQPRRPCQTATECGEDNCSVSWTCTAEGFCSARPGNPCPQQVGTCFRTECIQGVCLSAPDSDLCFSGDCSVGSCNNEGECIFDPVDDHCDDGADCTTDSCLPNSVSGGFRCENTPVHSFCPDDLHDCTIPVCDPGSDGADSDGCRFGLSDAVCLGANPGGDGSCVRSLCTLDGCTGIEPLPTCEAFQWCNTESGQCEPIPERTCDGCVGSNPCYGRLECNMALQLCEFIPVDSPCIPSSTNCVQTYCDVPADTSEEPSCEQRPDPLCDDVLIIMQPQP